MEPADELDRAVDSVVAALSPGIGRDWQAPAGSLEWSCRFTAEHAAHCLQVYAIQLASGAPAHYVSFFSRALQDATNADVLELLEASGRLLSAVVRAARPIDRGFHPFGTADVEGTAGMGCIELLVHGEASQPDSGFRSSRRRTSAPGSWPGCSPTGMPSASHSAQHPSILGPRSSGRPVGSRSPDCLTSAAVGVGTAHPSQIASRLPRASRGLWMTGRWWAWMGIRSGLLSTGERECWACRRTRVWRCRTSRRRMLTCGPRGTRSGLSGRRCARRWPPMMLSPLGNGPRSRTVSEFGRE